MTKESVLVTNGTKPVKVVRGMWGAAPDKKTMAQFSKISKKRNQNRIKNRLARTARKKQRG
jgi:hypothetical protein